MAEIKITLKDKDHPFEKVLREILRPKQGSWSGKLTVVFEQDGGGNLFYDIHGEFSRKDEKILELLLAKK